MPTGQQAAVADDASRIIGAVAAADRPAGTPVRLDRRDSAARRYLCTDRLRAPCRRGVCFRQLSARPLRTATCQGRASRAAARGGRGTWQCGPNAQTSLSGAAAGGAKVPLMSGYIEPPDLMTRDRGLNSG